MATTERAKAPVAASAGQTGQSPQIRWDDDKMQSAYANVCNVSSTREEVVLLFGVNQAWQREQAEVTIQLTNRIKNMRNFKTPNRTEACLEFCVFWSFEFVSNFGFRASSFLFSFLGVLCGPTVLTTLSLSKGVFARGLIYPLP